MKNKIINALKLVFPYKKLNFFVFALFFLGVIFGATFTVIINSNDKNLIMEKIIFFIDSINEDNLSVLLSFKNSLTINFTYLFFIWILGMTVVGIFVNLIILFLKGFVVGFSLASFIVTYSYKGLLLSSLYLIFGQLLNILIICMVTIYSVVFSYKILQLIFKNKNPELRRFLKSYIVILLILVVLVLISSIFECVLLPALIKVISNYFI